jgi:hypothetical protein
MFFRSLVVVSVVGVLSVASLAQVQLPDAPGKDETVRMCGRVMRWSARRPSVEPRRLAGHHREDGGFGRKASDEDRAKVLNYLAEHFKGEAPRPLNLNTATAIELESIVGLLRKESAAWIAHRKTSGPCKSLDDVKKAPGVPFKKIDEHRDRLVCF